MKSDLYFKHKVICYITGLFIMSLGSNLFLTASLGVAPSCTFALLLTEFFPQVQYSVFNFAVNFFLLLCEVILEKTICIKHALQLILTLIYSLFIQLTSFPLHFISPDFPVRILLCLLGCFVLAVGVSFCLNSGFAVLPMEGFVSALSRKSGCSFGSVRIIAEISMTAVSALLSILFLGSLETVGIGTLVAALCSGPITHWFSCTIHRHFRTFLGSLD